MENLIWLNDTIDSSLSKQLTGTFQARSDWAACKIALCLSPEGILKGQFDAGGQMLEIIGGVGKGGMAYGFLLDPVASVPVGLFRVRSHDHTLSLELDIPDFENLLDYCQPEKVWFERVDSLTKEAIPELAK